MDLSRGGSGSSKEGDAMRRILCLVLTVAVCQSTATFAVGPWLGGEIGIGAGNDQMDPGLALQGYFQFDDTREGQKHYLTLRGGISVLASEASSTAEADMVLFGLEAAALDRLKFEGAEPYLGGGLGYYLAEKRFSDLTNTQLALMGVGAKQKFDPNFGYFVMGGVTIPAAENISLGASAKYLILKVNTTGTATDWRTLETITIRKTVDLSTLFLSVSLQIGL